MLATKFFALGALVGFSIGLGKGIADKMFELIFLYGF